MRRGLKVAGRSFSSSLPTKVLDDIQAGALSMTYRGIGCFKSPFDLALYLRLISSLLPRTVIEIGTMDGGSALWCADMLSAHRIEDPKVVSVDIEPVAEPDDERLSFLRGDAKRLGDALPPDLLASCARPWLVVDDGSHLFDDVTASLEFFHPHLGSGDYVVVEDGIVGQFGNRFYEQFENGPNRAVARFLERFGHLYEIDEALCDRYGRNVTWSPNGWLRRL